MRSPLIKKENDYNASKLVQKAAHNHNKTELIQCRRVGLILVPSRRYIYHYRCSIWEKEEKKKIVYNHILIFCLACLSDMVLNLVMFNVFTSTSRVFYAHTITQAELNMLQLWAWQDLISRAGKAKRGEKRKSET